MGNKYFIVELIGVLAILIFIGIKALIKMSKLKGVESSDELRNMQD